jgi:hypothetical protein
MWYVYDGALGSARCHDRWIDTGGSTAWPPRSTLRSPRSKPGLNPLDIYLWGHLNTLVYAAPGDNEETLHPYTVESCQTIGNYPSVFGRIPGPYSDVSRRALNLTEDILSTYYKCTLSSIN